MSWVAEIWVCMRRSCGAMSHKTKDCMERPRSKGAKWTNKHIAADEKVEDIALETYEARRDRWNGYDAAEYTRVMDRCANTGIRRPHIIKAGGDADFKDSASARVRRKDRLAD